MNTNGCRWIIIILVVSVLGLSGIVAAQQQYDDVARIIALYGRPDQIKFSENEVPRPAEATKQLIYQRANVRVIFIPLVPMDSLPHRRWKLKGFLDLRTNQSLQPREADRRLRNR